MECAAVILAGGLSSRMGGGDKPLLELAGQSILAYAIERLRPQVRHIAINANGDADRFEAYGLPVIADTAEDYPGPLGGIEAGLAWAMNLGIPMLLTIAGDTPFFPSDLAGKLTDVAKADQIAVAASEGRLHPTFAVWPVSIADDLHTFLSSGERRVVTFIERHPNVGVDFPQVQLPGGTVDPFFNINTPADLAEARRLMDSSAL